MAGRLKDFLPTFVVIVAAFLVVFWLSNYVESAKPKLPESFKDTDLVLQGKKLKGYALGSEGMLADWYWMMALQYIGGENADSPQEQIDIGDLRNLNPRLLYPYLDSATDLDPSFFAAYSYGAIVLPAIDADKAIALTEKGIRNNPDKWRLHQYLGYIYWQMKNFEKAAETYEAGSQVAGAAPFMKEMAAQMRSKGGSRDVARAMFRQILESSEDEQSKRSAQLKLWGLDAEDEITAINETLTSAKAANGCPVKLSDVYSQLANIDLPNGGDFRIDKDKGLVDPTGVPYRFDASSCSVELGPESRLPKPLN